MRIYDNYFGKSVEHELWILIFWTWRKRIRTPIRDHRRKHTKIYWIKGKPWFKLDGMGRKCRYWANRKLRSSISRGKSEKIIKKWNAGARKKKKESGVHVFQDKMPKKILWMLSEKWEVYIRMFMRWML